MDTQNVLMRLRELPKDSGELSQGQHMYAEKN